MNKPAAFRATYSDWKLIRTRKCVQLVFEIPIEAANEAYTVLGGMPNSGEELWCAIARLDPKAIGAGPPMEAAASHDRATAASRKPVAPDKRLAQRAGILCADPLFRKWIGEIDNITGVTEEDAAIYVRAKCQVESRSEIKPGTEAAYRFAWIESAFVCWRDKDKYIEAAE